MNNGFLLSFCGAAIATIAPFFAAAQPIDFAVVHKKAVHRKIVQQDSSYKMLELKQLMPTLRYQLLYATANNFMHQKLYLSGSTTYLRMPVAKALLLAGQSFAQQGYGLIVWDAYRPFGVTKKMWKKIRDERYVANPAKGSGHNRGIAIDLTLYDLSSGEELDMGTGFDNFSDTAHLNFEGLSADQKRNRQLLQTVMEKFGFKALSTEWWHYSWQGKTFPVLDLSFRQLATLDN